MYLGAKLDLPIWNNFIESRIFYSNKKWWIWRSLQNGQDFATQLTLSFYSLLHFARFYFSLFPIPLEKKKKNIPSHYLLIFQALKSSSKGMITTPTFFSCMPLQPKFKVTHHDNTLWSIRPSYCACCPLPKMLQVACLSSKTSRMRTSYVPHTVHAILHAPKCD